MQHDSVKLQVMNLEGSGPRLSLTATGALTHLVIHRPREAPYLCLEPVSHVPNAVHLQAAGLATEELGLALLQPGESLVAQMRIVVEAAA